MVSTALMLFRGTQKGEMREPRIELGAQRWQRWILPLNHSRLVSIKLYHENLELILTLYPYRENHKNSTTGPKTKQLKQVIR